MRTINLGLEYKVEVPRNKLDKIAGDGFFAEEGSWKQILFWKQTLNRHKKENEGTVQADAPAYQKRETHYQQRMREGFQLRLVTPQELPPGVAGLYFPVSGQALAVDRESAWHEEEAHHAEYAAGNPILPSHEHDGRCKVRNMLNFYGKGGNYHQ